MHYREKEIREIKKEYQEKIDEKNAQLAEYRNELTQLRRLSEKLMSELAMLKGVQKDPTVKPSLLN